MTKAIIIDATETTESTVRRVELTCNAGKGEIETIVHHDAESHHIGNPEDFRGDESQKITIKARRFVAYSHTPGANAVAYARSMRDFALRAYPGIPVSLVGA